MTDFMTKVSFVLTASSLVHAILSIKDILLTPFKVNYPASANDFVINSKEYSHKKSLKNVRLGTDSILDTLRFQSPAIQIFKFLYSCNFSSISHSMP